MIKTIRLSGFLVLLAGLSCGYVASLGVLNLREEARSVLPDSYERTNIPSASMVNLATLYELSKEQFDEVLDLGQEAIMGAARRRNILVQSQDRVTMNQEAYEQLIMQADQEVELLRLKDYYSQFYLHYFRWLDSRDKQSGVQYRLALGQFKATLVYLSEKYSDGTVISNSEQEELGRFIRMAEQSDRSIRWAKVVVVMLIFLLVMGIPRFVRDKGYKKFSASLYFDAFFRPHLVSELSRWHSIKRMALIFPILYLFGKVLISSFVSWKFPLIIGSLGLFPVFLFSLMAGKLKRVPDMLVSFMAPKMLILILVLSLVALRGPGLLWYTIWESDLYRGILISLLLMLIFRKFYVNCILIRKWSHRNRIASASIVFLTLGLQLLIAGALMYGFGPENCIHTLNQELMLIPAKLVVFPSVLFRWVMIFAGVLSLTALMFFILNRRKLPQPSRST